MPVVMIIVYNYARVYNGTDHKWNDGRMALPGSPAFGPTTPSLLHFFSSPHFPVSTPPAKNYKAASHICHQSIRRRLAEKC